MIFDGKDPRLVVKRVRRPCLGDGCIDGMVEDANGVVTACPHCRGVGSTDLPIPRRISTSKRVPDGHLSKNLQAAMYDIAMWTDLYHWKQPSMVRLFQLGYVEKSPNPPRKDIFYWRLTEKGRKWLEQNPEMKKSVPSVTEQERTSF